METVEQLKQELKLAKFRYDTLIARVTLGLLPVPDPITGDLEKVKKLTFELSALKEDEVNIPFGATEQDENRQPQDVTETKATKRPGKPVDDETWVKSLEADPTYNGINVRVQLGKMSQWCLANNKTATRRRFINWLNRTEKPLTSNGSGPNNSRNEQTGAANAFKDRLAAIEAEARNSDQAGVERGTFGLSVGPTL